MKPPMKTFEISIPIKAYDDTGKAVTFWGGEGKAARVKVQAHSVVGAIALFEKALVSIVAAESDKEDAAANTEGS